MNSSGNDTAKPSAPSANGRARPTGEGMIHVQPPKREDLQPSYAQHIHGDDAAAHGWYGGMSKRNRLKSLRRSLTCPSQHHRILRRILWLHSMVCSVFVYMPLVADGGKVASSAPTPTSQSSKETLGLSPSLVASTARSIPAWSRSTRYLRSLSKSMSRFRSLV